MKRKEVIIQMLQLIVISQPSRYSRFVVLLSNDKERKEFVNEFYETLDIIPEWLIPKIIIKQSRLFETLDHKIMFVIHPCHLKGCSPNYFYFSNKISVEMRNEMMESLYPVFFALNVGMEEFE